MAIITKNRKQLKSYFVKNAIPTEGNFADLIDGSLNQAEDGVFKLAGEPLSVVAAPGEQKRVLRFYSSYPAPNADWHISLSPAQDPNNAATARPGFGVTDGAGNTRLFIDPATGNVGVGTNNPADRLHVSNGDVLIEGGRYRRLKVVSDSYWAGIELVARGKGEAGYPHIDFTNGDLGNPNFGLRLVGIDNKTLQLEGMNGQATLAVRGDVVYDGQQSKLDVKEQAAVTLRVHDLLLGHPARHGAPGRAFVDGTDALIVNFAKDWPRLDVHSPMTVAGDTTVSGALRATGGVLVDGAVAHIDTDGALYRNTDGQVYLTVDDHLYIRDLGANTWAAHFDTNAGNLDLVGKLQSARVGVGTADPQGPLDVRVPGVGGWDRFVVTAHDAWGDGNRHVTIGAGSGHGIMLFNPHIPWLGSENRASLRYGLSPTNHMYWDVGLRADETFTFAASNGGTALTVNGNGDVRVGRNLEIPGTQSKLDVAEQGAATIRVADFLIGHSGRRGQPGRALVDNKGALVVNFAKDWPRVDIGSPLYVGGSLSVGTAEPQGLLDVRVPGVGGWDRFVVNTTNAWGDGDTQYVTIGAGGAWGLMINNPHVSWFAAESRASIRYGRSGSKPAGAYWDVGVRLNNIFTFDSSTAGRVMTFNDNATVTVHKNLEVAGTANLGYAQNSANSFNAPLTSGFYEYPDPVGRVPDTSHAWVHMIQVRHSNQGNHHALQIASSYAQNDRLFFRKIARELVPADNANPWNEVATVTNGVLKIGNWTLSAEGNSLTIRNGPATVARFSTDWDHLQIYRNSNGVAPYFFFNAGGGYGAYNG
jgi:hypothetical protein